MNFLRPWVLLLLPAVAAWAAWEWRRTARRGGLGLKALLLALVDLALAQPRVTVFEKKVALALLADVSASVPAKDVTKQSDWISRLRAERGRHSMQVITFAGRTDTLRAKEQGGRVELTAGGRATNLEAALRDALSARPEGRVARLHLMSDGQENQGSVERAIYQARALGIHIDTFALEGTPRPELRVEALTLPAQAYSGEKFQIQAVIISPRAAPATVEITAEGKSIGRASVNLVEGKNPLRVRAQINSTGATLVSGLIGSAALGQARFDRIVSLRRPRLLLISREQAESTRHLRQMLATAQFEVNDSPGTLPRRLSDYQVVLVNNHHIESWPAEQKRQLEEYVREGGGFALIAGENNVYVENKPKGDSLERMLPATLAPPRTPEGTAVVLVVDKSSSMEGKKIDLARQSAIGVIENLRPIDLAGVLIFDNSFQWAVPIRKADNPALIKRLISGIMPDGGTQIAPALGEAYRQIQRVKAVYRHIVLLTDGISEEGDSMALAREAANTRVTISTVGLGQDVNRAYLEKVAGLAKGKAHFVLEMGNLEQLLLRDVMEHTGSSAVEKPVPVSVLSPVEILEESGLDKAPLLLGYLRFIAKPQAENILQVDGKDPLLVRWQYGLGRAAVFTSDAKARWAAQWVDWPGYDKLWTNLLRDLLPRAHPIEATAEWDSAINEIVARYRLQPGAEAPEARDELYVVGPHGFRMAAPLERVAASSFRARVPIGNRQGLFRIRAGGDGETFPEVGFYREETELAQYGADTELLRHIAEATGGRFNPTPRQAFDAGNRFVTTTLELWPGLLALAVLCNLMELASRKGYHLRRLWGR